MLVLPTHYCTKCNRDAHASHKHCGECGGAVARRPLPSDVCNCVRCGHPARRDTKHCTNCGGKPKWEQWEITFMEDYEGSLLPEDDPRRGGRW